MVTGICQVPSEPLLHNMNISSQEDMKHSKSTNAMTARDLVVKICSCCGEEVHLETVYISHGGTCMKMSNNEQLRPRNRKTSNANMKKLTLSLHFMQTVFHMELFWTDVLIILLRLAGRSEEINLGI